LTERSEQLQAARIDLNDLGHQDQDKGRFTSQLFELMWADDGEARQIILYLYCWTLSQQILLLCSMHRTQEASLLANDEGWLLS
jgi:hypothetical protein